MAAKVRCKCGETLRLPEASAGEVWGCPSCGEPIRAPKTKNALEIPIHGDEIERAGITADPNGDRDSGDPGAGVEKWTFGGRIPRQVIRGVFFVLVVLAGMIFLLKPKDPEVWQDDRIDKYQTGKASAVRVILNAPTQEAAEPGTEPSGPLATPPVSGKERSASDLDKTPAQPGQGMASSVAEKVAGEEQPETPPLALSPSAGGQIATETTEAAPGTGPGGAAAQVPALQKPLAERKALVEKFTLNVGSFRERKNAGTYKDELEKDGLTAFIREVRIQNKGTWYRVSVGKFSTREEAGRFARGMDRKWQGKVFVTELN